MKGVTITLALFFGVLCSKGQCSPDGQPLFLTPFIEKNQIEQGRAAAAVTPLIDNVQSFSGFFTVDKRYNSNMFFWFFPAEIDSDGAPVAVWLQGGPGGSSMYGLFAENGPFYLTKDQKLVRREYSWTKNLNLIFIDNPVGTGFSFTDKDDGYARTEDDVGQNVYEALVQFFLLFPEFRKNDFYITGESYAGKYIPATAYKIHTNNPKTDTKINLKGIAMGNALCDPETMMVYSDYLYQIGLIDRKTKKLFKAKENKMVSFIRQKKFYQAYEIFRDYVLNGSARTDLFNHTGFSFHYNYLYNSDNNPYGDYARYLNKNAIRRSIHVGKISFVEGTTVEKFLANDVMQSVKPWVEILIENYKVLLYNGQLDIIVAYPLTENFVKSLKWSGSSAYALADRQQWHVNGELAGYSKTVGNFTVLLVRNAGHIVPQDQPLWAFDMIYRFTNGKSF